MERRYTDINEAVQREIIDPIEAGSLVLGKGAEDEYDIDALADALIEGRTDENGQYYLTLKEDVDFWEEVQRAAYPLFEDADGNWHRADQNDNIGRDNFYKFTNGHFAPCSIPDREPDYRTKNSSYWFSDEGVVRLSDHWGTGIASCSWTLGDEPVERCHRNKALGQRSGFIAWKDFDTPQVTLKVSHRFGELDYKRLGATPLSVGHDAYGDFDVFAIERDWFTSDALHFSFAGRELSYHDTGSFTSALGDAYKDPRSQAISLAWNEYRLQAKADGEKMPDCDVWLRSQTENPTYGSLAKSLLPHERPAQQNGRGLEEREAAAGCDLDAEDRDARDASASLRECAPSANHGFEGR